VFAKQTSPALGLVLLRLLPLAANDANRAPANIAASRL